MKGTSEPTKKAPAEVVLKDFRRITKRQDIRRPLSVLAEAAQARIPLADWPEGAEQDGSDARWNDSLQARAPPSTRSVMSPGCRGPHAC